MSDDGPRNHTERVILAARSSAGGWTSSTLAAWGVPWPPPAGWRAQLVASDALRDFPIDDPLPPPGAGTTP